MAGSTRADDARVSSLCGRHAEMLKIANVSQRDGLFKFDSFQSCGLNFVVVPVSDYMHEARGTN